MSTTITEEWIIYVPPGGGIPQVLSRRVVSFDGAKIVGGADLATVIRNHQQQASG